MAWLQAACSRAIVFAWSIFFFELGVAVRGFAIFIRDPDTFCTPEISVESAILPSSEARGFASDLNGCPICRSSGGHAMSFARARGGSVGFRSSEILSCSTCFG